MQSLSESELLAELLDKITYVETRLNRQDKEMVMLKSNIALDMNEMASKILRTNNAARLEAQSVATFNIIDANGVAGNGEEGEDGEEEPRNLPIKLKKCVTKWMKVTAWNGFANILRAKTIFRKILWIILCLFLLGLTIYLLTITVLGYMDSSTIAISLITELPAQFPTLTICSLNPFFLSDKESLLSKLNNYSYYAENYIDGNAINLNNTSEALRLQKLMAAIKYEEFQKSIGSFSNQDMLNKFKDSTIGCKFLGKY